MKRKPKAVPVKIQGESFAQIYERLSKLKPPAPLTVAEHKEIEDLLHELSQDPGFMMLSIERKPK
jgi:hypothetical protein